MALIKATRGAQYPLYMEFVFNYNDTSVDSVSGATKTWGSTFGDNIVFDALPMPPGAVVVGGEVIVETAYVGPTAATISVGIAGSTTAFANAVDLKTAGRTALTISTTVPMTCNAGQNIRLTQSVTVANASAGKCRVRVFYTIDNRVNEAQIA